MKANYFLLCENLVIDNSDKVSLINLFNGITADSFPVAPARFVLVFSIALGKKDTKNKSLPLRISITDDSDGKVVLEVRGVNDEPIREGNMVSSLDLSGMIAIQKAGEYTASLYIKDEKDAVATLPFFVEPKENGKDKK